MEVTMAALYPTNEWCQEWKNAINNSDAIKEAGKDWGTDFNGNWIFEIKAGDGLDNTSYMFLEAKAGECTDIRLIDDPSEVESGFYCTGSYKDYKAAVKGEKDFIQGVVKGTFKLKGNIMTVMKYGGFIRILVDSLQKIESEFFEE
jgi:putative sterol carrier protein